MMRDTHWGRPSAWLLKLLTVFLELQLTTGLVLVSLILGVFLAPALAQEDCDAAVEIMGEEEHIFTNDNVQYNKSQMNLFVKMESSFEGFSVNVRDVDGVEYTAWFPAEDECFPEKDLWYQLLTFAQIKKNSIIVFGFETKTCRRECERDKVLQTLKQQTVVPRGSSRWRLTFPPGNCATAFLEAMSFSGELPTCAKPPAPMSTVIIIVIVIVVLVVMAVLVFAAVLGVKFFKNRATPCKYCTLFIS